MRLESEVHLWSRLILIKNRCLFLIDISMNSLPNDLLRLFLLTAQPKVTYTTILSSRQCLCLAQGSYLKVLMRHYKKVKETKSCYGTVKYSVGKLPNGELHDHCCIVHPNGMLTSQRTYYRGKPHGPDELWYTDGHQMIYEWNSDGKYRLLQIRWNPDGTVERRSTLQIPLVTITG
jgi:antitoxin component YwqK of YwqJK toxin-antitoxin module